MATPQAVTAVIRAARPDFKSSTDRLVFAVHAILSVNGFSLRKVGDGVDEAVAQGPSSLPSEEVGVDGWNQQPQGAGAGEGPATYSFLYVPEPGAQRASVPQGQTAPAPLLLLKCLPLDGAAGVPGAPGGQVLVSLADVASGRPPATLELPVDRYVPGGAAGVAAGPAAAAAGGYEQLPELISRVQGALGEVLEVKAQPAGTATTTTTSTSGLDSKQQQQQQEESGRQGQAPRPDPLRDERFPGGVGGGLRAPPGWQPVGVGGEDLMPGGLLRPPGGPGMVPLGPRGMGGGMLVGPENPIFADRLRHPRPGGPGGPYPGPGGGVPGMRWDPISPEGLQGWNPDDFTREGRTTRDEGLNDIGRPLPGRGPDWDHMFG